MSDATHADLGPHRATILAMLEESYAGPAWHGPSVVEALDGVSAAIAARKPRAERNSIWELVLHLAHGRHLLIERTIEREIAPFPREIREPWWPVSPVDTSDAAWRADVALLGDRQALLLDSIRRAAPSQLARVPPGSQHSVARQLLGMALHDSYHAGQIRLLSLMAGDTE
jgi:uncharacterized damage-inducible protein DinB